MVDYEGFRRSEDKRDGTDKRKELQEAKYDLRKMRKEKEEVKRILIKGEAEAGMVNETLHTGMSQQVRWEREDKQREVNFLDIIEQQRQEERTDLEKGVIRVMKTKKIWSET